MMTYTNVFVFEISDDIRLIKKLDYWTIQDLITENEVEIKSIELDEIAKQSQITKDLLEALKANMDWIGPPPVDKYSYDSQRERAWELGKQAIAKAEGGE